MSTTLPMSEAATGDGRPNPETLLRELLDETEKFDEAAARIAALTVELAPLFPEGVTRKVGIRRPYYAEARPHEVTMTDGGLVVVPVTFTPAHQLEWPEEPDRGPEPLKVAFGEDLRDL